MGGWTWRWACGLRPARGKSGGRVEGNESETEGRHSEDVVVEKEEEVKGRMGCRGCLYPDEDVSPDRNVEADIHICPSATSGPGIHTPRRAPYSYYISSFYYFSFLIISTYPCRNNRLL